MKKFSGIQILIVTMTIMSSHLFAAAETQSDDLANKCLAKCNYFRCGFRGLKEPNWYPYILAQSITQYQEWERSDIDEDRHTRAKQTFATLQQDPARNMEMRQLPVTFWRTYMEGKDPAVTRRSTELDWQRAVIVFTRYIDLFKLSTQQCCAGTPIPIVMEDIQSLAEVNSEGRVLHGGTSANCRCDRCNTAIHKIAFGLARIRYDKDGRCYQELLQSTLAVLNKSSSTPASSSSSTIYVERADEATATDVQSMPHFRRLPFGFGLFAGLGLSGSVWFAAYLLRSCQDRIRVASGCASAAAGMAFLFARHKLAQEFGNTEFWQGMRYGAGVSVLASAGLFAAHDSPMVQKLLAAASRTK